MKIYPITPSKARDFMCSKHCVLPFEEFNFAIAAGDDDGLWHGAIGMYADGDRCWLGHLYTDGTALVGSILYGAAWRAAKALGYTEVGI